MLKLADSQLELDENCCAMTYTHVEKGEVSGVDINDSADMN